MEGNEHYEMVLKLKEKFEKQGYKVVNTELKIPDLIIFKDKRLIAVEVLSTKNESHIKLKKEYYSNYDDIFVIFCKKPTKFMKKKTNYELKFNKLFKGNVGNSVEEITPSNDFVGLRKNESS